MEFDSVIHKRRSVRSFKSKKPDWRDVMDAIDAALQGPYAGNQNNLRFMIVENEEKIREVAVVCEQDWIGETKIIVLVCSDDTHLEEMYGERGRIFSRQQSGAAINTILMKLIDLGLDGCWVGAYADRVLKDKFEIPGHVQIEGVIPIGYDKDSRKKKTKKDLERALYWEKWKQTRRPTMFEESLEEPKGP